MMIWYEIVALIVLAIALVVAGPLLVIWALNTLFGLGIATTLATWCAAFVLAGMFAFGSAARRR